MEQMIPDLIKNLGVPIALVAYYLYKDWQMTQKIVELMAKIDAFLEMITKEKMTGDNGAK